MQANSAVDRELRNEALDDLCARVVDWKNHRVDHFGDLLLYGHFPVVTGKSDVQKEVRPFPLRKSHSRTDSKDDALFKYKTLSSRSKTKFRFAEESMAGPETEWELVPPIDPEEDTDELRRWSSPVDVERFLKNKTFYQELCNPPKPPAFLPPQIANVWGNFRPSTKQYTIYLFERILLCCKDDNPNKSKDKLMGAQKDKKDRKDKRNKDGVNKNAKLQLKGRIFMTNVTEVVSLSKQGM